MRHLHRAAIIAGVMLASGCGEAPDPRGARGGASAGDGAGRASSPAASEVAPEYYGFRFDPD